MIRIETPPSSIRGGEERIPFNLEDSDPYQHQHHGHEYEHNQFPNSPTSALSSTTTSAGILISELSPGEKMSLKGKIFELQKKLNIIEVTARTKEEYPFRPEIVAYDLPERQQRNVLGNIERAEMMRKQKLELLKATVKREEAEDNSFSPKLISSKARRDAAVNKIHSNHNKSHTNGGSNSNNGAGSSEKVYTRLYDMGKEYREKQTQRVIQARKYDADGRKLFEPTIPKGPYNSGSEVCIIMCYVYIVTNRKKD